jgi:hypothetical protein
VIAFFAHFLFILAGWTLVIKFIFPIGYALADGTPPLTLVYWDFWWVVHIWLGWALLHWRRYTYALAVTVSVAEIAIIVTKFVRFWRRQWTIWRITGSSTRCSCSPASFYSRLSAGARAAHG